MSSLLKSFTGDLEMEYRKLGLGPRILSSSLQEGFSGLSETGALLKVH